MDLKSCAVLLGFIEHRTGICVDQSIFFLILCNIGFDLFDVVSIGFIEHRTGTCVDQSIFFNPMQHSGRLGL